MSQVLNTTSSIYIVQRQINISLTGELISAIYPYFSTTLFKADDGLMDQWQWQRHR